jgi:hypothetical protein
VYEVYLGFMVEPESMVTTSTKQSPGSTQGAELGFISIVHELAECRHPGEGFLPTGVASH